MKNLQNAVSKRAVEMVGEIASNIRWEPSPARYGVPLSWFDSIETPWPYYELVAYGVESSETCGVEDEETLRSWSLHPDRRPLPCFSCYRLMADRWLDFAAFRAPPDGICLCNRHAEHLMATRALIDCVSRGHSDEDELEAAARRRYEAACGEPLIVYDDVN